MTLREEILKTAVTGAKKSPSGHIKFQNLVTVDVDLARFYRSLEDEDEKEKFCKNPRAFIAYLFNDTNVQDVHDAFDGVSYKIGHFK